jgi:hypothetical protein
MNSATNTTKCSHSNAAELASYTKFANGILRYGIDAYSCPDCGKVGRFCRPPRVKANSGRSQYAVGGKAPLRWR